MKLTKGPSGDVMGLNLESTDNLQNRSQHSFDNLPRRLDYLNLRQKNGSDTNHKTMEVSFVKLRPLVWRKILKRNP